MLKIEDLGLIVETPNPQALRMLSHVLLQERAPAKPPENRP